jgi:hypothetical protein
MMLDGELKGMMDMDMHVGMHEGQHRGTHGGLAGGADTSTITPGKATTFKTGAGGRAIDTASVFASERVRGGRTRGRKGMGGAREAAPSDGGTNLPNRQPAFLGKTYQIVDECSLEGKAAAWSADGKSFTVLDPNEFANKHIPKHFKHSNFSSFVRQMNFYGFLKTKVGQADGKQSQVHPSPPSPPSLTPSAHPLRSPPMHLIPSHASSSPLSAVGVPSPQIHPRPEVAPSGHQAENIRVGSADGSC